MKIKGVIFDADGTLLDSMGFWSSTVYDMLARFGISPDNELLKIINPMSMYEGAVYLKNRYSLSFSPEEFIEEENRIVEQFYTNKVKLKPGIAELLDMLSRKNIPLAVASATDRYLIEKALRTNGIHEHFKAVVSCSDVGEGKNSPKVYNKAREYLGTEICETAVVEDSPNALITAGNAGYLTVGVYDKEHLLSDYSGLYDLWFPNKIDYRTIETYV